MNTVIYLSNSNIQIAIGESGKKSASIQKLYSIDIAEGSLLNGVIISEGQLQKELSSIWEGMKLPKKRIRLIIDSTQFFTRTITLPQLNEKKTQLLLQKEFAEIENSAEYLFDYRPVQPDQKTGLVQILAVAVEKNFIRSYVEFFKELNIEIGSIDIALNGQLKVYERVPQADRGTFISTCLEGSNLVSTLMVDGQFQYFNRARLFAAHGTEEFGVEVARTISGIMQFHATQKDEHQLEQIILCGFEEGDYQVSLEALKGLEIEAGVSKEEPPFQMPDKENLVTDKKMVGEVPRVSDYLFVAGGLLTTTKDLNFYKRYMQSTRQKESVGLSFQQIVAPVCVLGVCLLISAVLLGVNFQKEYTLNKVNQYLKDDQTKKLSGQAKELTQESMEQQESITVANTMEQVLASFPKANMKVEEQVKGCAGTKVTITVDAYEAATGVYQFTAMAAQVTDIYDFINQLEGTKLFANLEYSGYNFTEETAQYDIHVSGYLSETAGK
ncbi:MAG: hypothetical protein RR369_03595 [Lachnospiraceae bacterium]